MAPGTLIGNYCWINWEIHMQLARVTHGTIVQHEYMAEWSWDSGLIIYSGLYITCIRCVCSWERKFACITGKLHVQWVSLYLWLCLHGRGNGPYMYIASRTHTYLTTCIHMLWFNFRVKIAHKSKPTRCPVLHVFMMPMLCDILSDMAPERNKLMLEATPKLKKICYNMGLDFQVICSPLINSRWSEWLNSD